MVHISLRPLVFAIIASAPFWSPLAEDVTPESDLTINTGSDRPAAVPKHYVVTPHGYFDPSCVIEVNEAEFVDADDNIVGRDGIKRPLKMCLFPHYRGNGQEVWPLFAPPPYIGHSYVADVRSNSVGAISWLSANWIVPNNPPSANSQTLYYFPGGVPPSFEFILQPVLGWNAGTPGWTIASWNCCRNGNNLHSPLMGVSPGMNLYGYIWGTNCDPLTGVCANWQVLTSAANGPQTTLNTDSYGQTVTLNLSGALEVYAVGSCAEYPSNNSTAFTNVAVRNAVGASVQPAWTATLYDVTPLCNRSATFTDTTATIGWVSCTPSCGSAICGTQPDGCGGTMNCGTCGARQYCGSGGYCYCSYPYRNCGERPPNRPDCRVTCP